MKIIISILTKTLVRQFYQQHTGFFLLVIGVCFGFMSSVEHKALAQFFISSPLLLCIPCSLWTVYTVQIILFNKKILQLPECEFLYNVGLLPNLKRMLILMPVLLMELMPVILYGIFLLLMALQANHLWTLTYIPVILIIFIISSVCHFSYAILHPNCENQSSRLITFLNLNFRRPYFQFFIEWIIRKDFLAFAGIKLFSCLLIFAVSLLYLNETYDARLLGMALSIAFTANAFLIYQYHEFENRYFTILRNLPFSLSKRLFNFCIVFLFITAPELIVLHHNFPSRLGFIFLIESILLGISTLILLYGLLYIKSVELERFIKHSFIISFACIIIILFMMPWWIIILGNTALGIFLFMKNYYAFESNVE